MAESNPDPVEGLKENALSSYGNNRLDAIETLATFGEEAIPALVEITNKSSNEEPQQLARAKIREINQANPDATAHRDSEHKESSSSQMSVGQDSEGRSEESEGNL